MTIFKQNLNRNKQLAGVLTVFAVAITLVFAATSSSQTASAQTTVSYPHRRHRTDHLLRQ